MDAAPKSVLNKLERSLGSIAAAGSRPDDWNLLPVLRPALLRAVAEHAKIARNGSTVEMTVNQQSLFGPGRNPVVDALVRVLDEKPNAVREKFAQYAKDSSENPHGAARMFGGGEAFDAFNHAFGSKLTEEEFHNAVIDLTKTSGTASAAQGVEEAPRRSGEAIPQAAAGGDGLRAAESAAGGGPAQHPEPVASPTKETGKAGPLGKGSVVTLPDGQAGVVEHYQPSVNGSPERARVRMASGEMRNSVKPEEMTPVAPKAVNPDKPWVGVDLDGTLAHYDGFKGPEFIGEPVPAMVDRVKQMLADGQDVRIFTARVSSDATGKARAAIEAWSQQHLGQALPITDVKDDHMTQIFDYRAVQVERNTGKIVGGNEAAGPAGEAARQQASKPASQPVSEPAKAPETVRRPADEVRDKLIAKGLLDREMSRAKNRNLSDNLQAAKVEALPAARGGDPSVLMLSPDAYHAILKMEDRGFDWGGGNVARSDADHLVSLLHSVESKARQMGDSRTTKSVRDLASAIDNARDRDGGLTLLAPGADDATIREELVHRWQRREGLLGSMGLEEAANDPRFERLWQALEEKGYGPARTKQGRDEIVAELLGKSLAGDQGLKASAEQRQELMGSLLRAAVDEKGPEALDRLPVLDAEAQKAIEEARSHGKERDAAIGRPEDLRVGGTETEAKRKDSAEPRDTLHAKEGPERGTRGVQQDSGSGGAEEGELGRFFKRQVNGSASTLTAPFGPVHREFHHDTKGAVERLLSDKDGEAVAALYHPEVGDIDLIYGKERSADSSGFGLAKIAQLHPEVLSDLQGFIDRLHIATKSPNRIRLADKSGLAVIRLSREDSDRPWLLTAYEKNSDALKAAEGGRTAVTYHAEPTPENPAGQEASNKSTLPRNERAGAKETVTGARGEEGPRELFKRLTTQRATGEGEPARVAAMPEKDLRERGEIIRRERSEDSTGNPGRLYTEHGDERTKALAIQSKQAGARPEDIWDRYGWFEFGGKWRSSIPFADFEIKQSITPEPQTLGDVLHFPELFKIYPQARDVVIRTQEEKGLNAGLSRDGKEIILSRNADRDAALKHEIQHLVQLYEGRAPASFYGEQILQMMHYMSDPAEVEARESVESMDRPALMSPTWQEVFSRRENRPVTPESFEEHIAGGNPALTRYFNGSDLPVISVKPVLSKRVEPEFEPKENSRRSYSRGITARGDCTMRRLFGELGPKDPRPVTHEVYSIQLDLPRGTNAVQVESRLKEMGFKASAGSPTAVTVEIYDKTSGKASPMPKDFQSLMGLGLKGATPRAALTSGEEGPGALFKRLTAQRGGRLPGEVPLPGMEGDVKAQDEAAAAKRGEELTKEMRQPLGDISKAAGEMERESPLFYGTGENPALFKKGEAVPELHGLTYGEEIRQSRRELLAAQKELPYGGAPVWQRALGAFKDWRDQTPDAGGDLRSLVRDTRGEMDHQVLQLKKSLEDARKDFVTMPREEVTQFIDHIEHRRFDRIDPKYQELARGLHGIFIDDRLELQLLDPEKLKNFYENYFPHIWDHSGKVARQIAAQSGKQPLFGSGSFLQHRTLYPPTFKEGIEIGLEPKSWNYRRIKISFQQ